MHEIPQQGSTAEIFFPRLVARLHRSGFEGVARVSSGIAVRAIYFRGGEIASAASNDEQDRLQSLLLNEGRLTAPQVEMALTRQKPGVSLGKTLIEMGFLTPSELLECARRQVRQILATCFAQTGGEFHLEPGPLPSEVTILGLPTRRLIFDALMQVGDRRRIVGEMGSMESVYSPTDEVTAGLATLQLDPAIEQVARAIDGVQSMRDLSAATAYDDFTLSKAILALEILALVDRRDAPRPAAGQPPKGRIIPVESVPGEVPAAEPTPDLDTDEAQKLGPDPAADHGASGERDAEPPPIRSDDLPAFAVPPSEETAPPQWNVDPKTGERIHEGPIEMTFDGLVRSKDRPQAVSTRLFAVTAGIVAVVVLAFFLFAPGSQKEPPNIAGIGESDPAPLQAGKAPPPRADTPRPGRPRETAEKDPAAADASAPPGDEAPSSPSPAETSPPARVAAAPAGETLATAGMVGGDAQDEPASPSPAPPGPPAAALDGAAMLGRSPEFAAAVAQLDRGQLAGAAQGFARMVASQEPGRFTLQLMIACQPETVTRAHAEAGDGSLLFVLPYSYKGQSCYRACWGIYPDGRAAQAAIGSLPGAYSEAGIKPIAVALQRLRGSR